MNATHPTIAAAMWFAPPPAVTESEAQQMDAAILRDKQDPQRQQRLADKRTSEEMALRSMLGELS